jgi:hypothetical protein
MSLNKMVKRQRDFSAGQIDENARRRDDRPEFKYGIRRGRNCVASNSGSLKRRIGRKYLYPGAGVRDEFRPFTGLEFQITFAAGKFEARQNGAIVANLPAPWTSAMLPKLRWAYAIETIIVCGPSPMRPQVIVYTQSTNSWAISDFTLDLSVNNAKRAAFFRFEANGVTMLPSARTGTITLTTSGPAFKPAHVGVNFRYVGKQVQITDYVSPTVANALVLEELPPTYRVELASSAGYSVGEIVEATPSGFKGEVIVIPDATHVDIVSINSWNELANGDKLVGPVDSEMVLSFVTIAAGATSQWDEEFMSDVRGWPQSVSTDVQRMIFCHFPQSKNFILWSAVNAPFDCYLSGSATAAILEYIPQECTIYHVIGGYDEFALTDAGAYYIPISGGSPLQPGSVEFRQISSSAIADVTPITVTEGVIYVESTLNRISAITATGQTARPYQVSEISRYHNDLFNGIVALAASTSDPTIAGRQMYVVNADGSFVVGRYEQDRDYVGWFAQGGQGRVTHVQSRYDAVIFSVIYGVEFAVAEQVDETAVLDCSINLFENAGVDYLELSNGATLELFSGEPLTLDRFLLAAFAGMTMQAMADGFYLSDVTIGAGGKVTIPGSYAQITLGFKWDLEFEPNLEDFEGGEAFGQRLRRRKISQALMAVRNTQQFRIGTREYGTYRQGDNMDVPVVARSDVYKYRETGRSWDPNFRLVQDIPGAFELLELTTEMTI